MPRLPRINLEGAIYYVTAKGAQNQVLFNDKVDYKMYLELLAKYKKEHQFKLFSYCLLPDHLELLIETSDDLPDRQAGATISEIMHDLNSLYTKYFNGAHGKRGHLFDARFKSVLAEKASMLLALTRQIHLAPSENPKEYPYSSFRIYLSATSSRREEISHPVGLRDDSMISASSGSEKIDVGMTERLDINDEIKEVRRFLSEKDDPQIYERYCLEGDTQEIETLRKKLKRGQIVGSESFEAEVRNRMAEYSREQEEAANLKAPVWANRTLILIAGLTVLIAGPTGLFLYISKQSVESKYQALLMEKEAVFTEKTRFEKRSPIGLAELDGTAWNIELVLTDRGNRENIVKDKIIFNQGRFSSSYFGGKGFRSASYFLVPQSQGAALWQTAQSDPSGASVRWSGDWRGNAMKGLLTFQSSDGAVQGFSFFSEKWSRVHETK